MPYKSEAQRKFFNSKAGKEKLGEAEVEHWNKESEGMKLPEKVKDTLDKAIKSCDSMYQEIESAGPYMLTKSDSGRWAVLRNGMPIKYGMEREMRELYKKVLKANGYSMDKAIKACDDDRPSVLLEELKRNVAMTKNYADEINRMKSELGKLDSEFNELRRNIFSKYKDNEYAMEALKMKVSERNKIKR